MRFLSALLAVVCSACSWSTAGCEYGGPEPSQEEYEEVEDRLGLPPGYIRAECGPVYLQALTPEEADYWFVSRGLIETCGDHAFVQYVPARAPDGLTVTHEVMHWALKCLFGNADRGHTHKAWYGLRVEERP